MISRRRLLGSVFALASARRTPRAQDANLAGTRQHGMARRGSRRFDRAALESAPAYAVDVTGVRVDAAPVTRTWSGPFCRARVVHRGVTPIRLKEIVLFDLDSALPASTKLYGEGFQMLSQTGGTLGSPLDFSQYTDAGHYRLPAAEGSRACYGLLTLTPPGDDVHLLAFTSCARFAGRFELRGSRLRAVLEVEGLEIAPGAVWPLEELLFVSGSSRPQLLADVARRLALNHPPLTSPSPPTGWCSWYCFGPRVTAQQVLDNLDAIASDLPSLKYILRMV